MSPTHTSALPSPGDSLPAHSLSVQTHPVHPIFVGTVLRVYGVVTANGQPFEPDDLTFEVTTPLGERQQYLDIVCESDGVYFVRVSLDVAGPYELKVRTSGEDAQVVLRTVVAAPA